MRIYMRRRRRRRRGCPERVKDENKKYFHSK
jgi:hypothetical protein